MDVKPDRVIRQLLPGENIPYHILLLADESIESIDRYVHESKIFVLEYDDRFIAAYVIQPVNSSVIEIKNIAVENGYRGQGIGRSLIADAIQRAKEWGYREVIIGTGDAAPGLIAWYESAGFIQYARKKDFFSINFPYPIFEDGVQLRDMVMLKITITS